MLLVPALLTLCGEPVRAVHIDVRTPGFCSHDRLVRSESDSAVAVARAWMVRLLIRGLEGRGELGVGFNTRGGLEPTGLVVGLTVASMVNFGVQGFGLSLEGRNLASVFSGVNVL